MAVFKYGYNLFHIVSIYLCDIPTKCFPCHVQSVGTPRHSDRQAVLRLIAQEVSHWQAGALELLWHQGIAKYTKPVYRERERRGAVGSTANRKEADRAQSIAARCGPHILD